MFAFKSLTPLRAFDINYESGRELVQVGPHAWSSLMIAVFSHLASEICTVVRFSEPQITLGVLLF